MSKVLVPAVSLRADYQSDLQVLTLEATGTVPSYILDIQFARLLWIGEWKFELFGWRAIGIPEQKKYKHSQKFITPNPPPYVIIVTANHPQGQKVPVRWLGLTGEPTEQPIPLVTGEEGPKTFDREATTIRALFGEPFEIKEHVDCAPGSTLRVQFNEKALVIQSAGFEDGNMVWTMNSLQMGVNQFIVYKKHGFDPVVTQKVYNIEVFVLDNAVTTADLQSLDKASNIELPLWSFKERLIVAELIVKRLDPSARYIKVKATRAGYHTGQPVYDAEELQHLTAWFTSDKGTWQTESRGGMNWTNPVLKKDIIVGLVPFDILALKYDLVGAVSRMRGDGYGLPFFCAELYARFVRAPSDPEYVFHMSDDTSLSVDAINGVITPQKPLISFSSTDSDDGTEVKAAANGANGTNGVGAIAAKQIEAPLPPVGVAA